MSFISAASPWLKLPCKPYTVCESLILYLQEVLYPSSNIYYFNHLVKFKLFNCLFDGLFVHLQVTKDLLQFGQTFFCQTGVVDHQTVGVFLREAVIAA